ncbi:MAG: hypothetical protein ACTSRG_01555 [Candidatus Helarchaeota archaeon]
MVTVSIKKDTHHELIKIAADLQKKLGKKIDFDNTIRYLIDLYTAKMPRPKLFEKFCEPIEGITFDLLYDDLQKERKIDEKN